MITLHKKTNFLGILLLLFSFQVFAASPKKLSERGEYDRAIRVAVKKLAGKKKKKLKHVLALEEAFHKANIRDLGSIKALKRAGQPGNWDNVNALYRQIMDRQRLVRPLTPLIAKNGYAATVQFHNVSELEHESRVKAATYYYAKAENYLGEARKGDKMAARRAYDYLLEVDKFYSDFRDKRLLKQEALSLGKTRVLVNVKNEIPYALPPSFFNKDIRVSLNNMNSRWLEYHNTKLRDLNYDYEISLRFTHADVSPELIKEREYREQKQIRDGFKYVLDANGNVLKDSLGNDIKEPRYRLVRAFVIETLQQKEAVLNGRMEVRDLRNNQITYSNPVTANAVFENYASTFRGDQRALSEETKCNIGNHPVPFPTNTALLMQAAEQLIPAFTNQMRRQTFPRA